MSATAVPSVKKPVECGAADIALYVGQCPPTGAADLAQAVLTPLDQDGESVGML